MSLDNLRKSKLVGMNQGKLDAMKRIRKVRNGEGRLDQAIKVK
jgi:hypothetical protein